MEDAPLLFYVHLYVDGRPGLLALLAWEKLSDRRNQAFQTEDLGK